MPLKVINNPMDLPFCAEQNIDREFYQVYLHLNYIVNPLQKILFCVFLLFYFFKNVAGLLYPATIKLLLTAYMRRIYCGHPGVCVNWGLRRNSSCAIGRRLL
jgi:hypothetical protein